MTLSRWRRIATGIAAGVIVLCAALLGSALRTDNAGVSVASELRPAVVIPIEEDPVEGTEAAEVDTGNTSTTDDSAPEDDSAQDSPSDGDSTPATTPGETATTDDALDDSATPQDDTDAEDEPLTEPVQVGGTDNAATDDAQADDTAAGDTTADDAPTAESDTAGSDTAAEPSPDDSAATPTEPAPATPAAPLTSSSDNLGTGGGVNDAECALDRLVIYAGARRGGVAGSIRAALAQAGFAAGCSAPVTVLASNCPLQFAGVLGAGSGYDPNKSYVASSASVDRETMTAVMGTVGYAGAQIDILDFGFVNPDRPGEQWMAIFIPPSFDGWQNLASRAGLAPTAQSLCSPSGQLAG